MSRFRQLDPADYSLPPDLAARLQSPTLIVYLDKVRENLRRMLALMQGASNRWRPHVKTTKLPAIWNELAAAGIRNYKCATTREAEQLAITLEGAGVHDADILLAYPLLGPGLARLGQIAHAHPKVSFSVLCEEAARVTDCDDSLGIFIDLNPGMNRTGLPMEDDGEMLAIAQAAGERFRGLHYYDGHLHGADLEERRSTVHRGYDALLPHIDRLSQAGCQVDELITAGTPAFSHALHYAPFEKLEGCVHRISPGTVVLHDLRSEQENADLDLLPAAIVFSRVISHPTADCVTCDAGSKALAAEAGDPAAFVLGHPELQGLPQSEEHFPLRVTSGALPARGTELYLIPRHVCPTVNLAEKVVLLDGEREPRIVPVTARAHELLVDGKVRTV